MARGDVAPTHEREYVGWLVGSEPCLEDISPLFGAFARCIGDFGVVCGWPFVAHMRPRMESLPPPPLRWDKPGGNRQDGLFNVDETITTIGESTWDIGESIQYEAAGFNSEVRQATHCTVSWYVNYPMPWHDSGPLPDIECYLTTPPWSIGDWREGLRRTSLHLPFVQTPGPHNVASALFCGEILS